MNDGRKGYWEGMPMDVKVMSGLTVLMIVAGVTLLSLGYDQGIGLIILPGIFIFLRMVLTDVLFLRGTSFFEYTFSYWFGHMERKYHWFPMAFVGVVVGFFVFIWYTMD